MLCLNFHVASSIYMHMEEEAMQQIVMLFLILYKVNYSKNCDSVVDVV